MEVNFFELVKKAQNQDNDALLQLIAIYNPTIKKFSRQLNYEEAETDLIIAFIETIRKIKLTKLITKKWFLVTYTIVY